MTNEPFFFATLTSEETTLLNTPVEISVWFAIKSFAGGPEHICFASIRKIAERAKVGNASVLRAVKVFEEKGLLKNMGKKKSLKAHWLTYHFKVKVFQGGTDNTINKAEVFQGGTEVFRGGTQSVPSHVYEIKKEIEKKTFFKEDKKTFKKEDVKETETSYKYQFFFPMKDDVSFLTSRFPHLISEDLTNANQACKTHWLANSRIFATREAYLHALAEWIERGQSMGGPKTPPTEETIFADIKD